MVSCSKDGHSHSETFESSANAAMWGNLIFGGINSAVIDWQDTGFSYEAIIANLWKDATETSQLIRFH